jgi:hypothetical protein
MVHEYMNKGIRYKEQKLKQVYENLKRDKNGDRKMVGKGW